MKEKESNGVVLNTLGQIESIDSRIKASEYLIARRADVRITRESIADALGGYVRAREADYQTYRQLRDGNTKSGLALEGPGVYADAIRPFLEKPDSALEVLKCANALGTLNGVLVTQRSLDFLKFDYPELRRVSFDFSPEMVRFNQPVTTRLRTVPAATRYDAASGYATSDVVNRDATFNVNMHGAVQIAYTANDLSGTKRLLFPEQQEGLHHSMGLDICTNLFALATAGNFPGQVGDGTAGQPSSLTVPGKTVVTSDQMSRLSVIAVKSALNQRGATGGIRTILLTEIYHDALEGSLTTVTNGNDADPDKIQAVSRLPLVGQFRPIEAPYLPTANNLQGFAFRADALAVAVRPAADYSKILPQINDGGGEMDLVTSPETGFTVCMCSFIDHCLGKAYLRLAYVFGVGVGNPAAGQLICSK